MHGSMRGHIPTCICKCGRPTHFCAYSCKIAGKIDCQLCESIQLSKDFTLETSTSRSALESAQTSVIPTDNFWIHLCWRVTKYLCIQISYVHVPFHLW